MFKKLAVAAVAAALTLPITTVVSAEAATSYSSCAKLQRDFKYGVAKSAAAARYQVRQGNHRPAYGKRARNVYAKVKGRLDRDKDGTACER